MEPTYAENFLFSARDQDVSAHPASTEDVLFDMFRNEETDLLPIGMFLSVSNFDRPCSLLRHSLPKNKKFAHVVTILARRTYLFTSRTPTHTHARVYGTK